jgi:hypothetical protein
MGSCLRSFGILECQEHISRCLFLGCSGSGTPCVVLVVDWSCIDDSSS